MEKNVRMEALDRFIGCVQRHADGIDRKLIFTFAAQSENLATIMVQETPSVTVAYIDLICSMGANMIIHQNYHGTNYDIGGEPLVVTFRNGEWHFTIGKEKSPFRVHEKTISFEVGAPGLHLITWGMRPAEPAIAQAA